MLRIAKIYLLSIASLVIGKNMDAQRTVTINSPDKRINAEVIIDNKKKATYRITYLGEEVLQPSKLGIIREDADFSNNLQFVSAPGQALVKDNYTILNAKKSHISYIANKRVIALQNSTGEKMNIIFQVSNDGVAFRYTFPGPSIGIKKINSELTSFHFKEGARAWLQPKTEAQSGWEHSNPSYEAHYMMDIPTGTPSPGKNGWVYPAMFHYNNTWLLITEAALGRNYCGTSLQQQSPGSEYHINFPQEPEKFTNGVLYPQSELPWQMPWRIIALGSLKTIVESTLGTDLAFPAIKMPAWPVGRPAYRPGRDFSFIKPGKASWSWILSKDNFIVYDEQKKYIDHAADMHWEYCLVDAAWDKKIGLKK